MSLSRNLDERAWVKSVERDGCKAEIIVAQDVLGSLRVWFYKVSVRLPGGHSAAVRCEAPNPEAAMDRALRAAERMFRGDAGVGSEP
jgi:hypothetical protein